MARKVDYIRIIISRPDNIVHVMGFMTRVYMPGENGDVIQEIAPTHDNIEKEILRNGPYIEYKIVEDDSEVPTDRTYRDAWKFENGKIVICPVRSNNIAMERMREKRNELLEKSDTHVLPDRWYGYTEEQKAAWAKYRQDLRDAPATLDPFDPVWPEMPKV